jgi:signal transduction histidine kinase
MLARRFDGPPPRWSRVVRVVAPVTVVVAGLSGSVAARGYEQDVLDRALADRVELVARVLSDELALLLEAEISATTATAAALSVDPDLDRASFGRFATGLLDQVPSLLGIGYVRRVADTDLDELVRTARADGAPELSLSSLGPGPEHAILLFNEPESRLRSSWGVDLSSIDEAWVALERAMVTGRLAVTEALVLAVDRVLPEDEQPVGYVTYAPVYRPGAPTATEAERRAALAGWSNVPFRAQDLLDELRLPAATWAVLRDGGPAGRPVAEVGAPVDGPGDSIVQAVASRTSDLDWHLEVAVPRSALPGSVDRPSVAFAAGVLLTAVLAALVTMLSQGSQRWERAARQATEEVAARARALERSNRDLQEFATVAAHELSEPLTVVGGYTDLLLHRGRTAGFDEASMSHLETIAASVARMRSLLQALLDMSRLRSDAAPHEPVSLGDVVDRALANLEVALADSGAEVDVGRLPEVRGSRDQLVQVVQNLVGNAIRYRSPERPLVIRISASRAPGTWEVRVADNGIGIPAEHRERIFGMFRRLHGRDEYGGLGVGLAVCRRVIELHGGRIWVEDSPGGGATFGFTLPDVAPGQDPLEEL